MASLELGEPLLQDSRLHQLASRFVVEFPELLDFNSDFATWVQEPKEVVLHDGLVRKIPHVAVLAIVSDNPRFEGQRLLTKGAMSLEHWQAEDISSSSDADDAAGRLYRPILQDHLQKLRNLRDMMN